MTRDTRCAREISFAPCWRCYVDERRERPGELAINGVSADYQGNGFRVVVTAMVSKERVPRQVIIDALDEALRKVRGYK
jgi:hypothetical protein